MTALTGVISYPIPLYQNVPIQSQYYKPRRWVISDMTLGQTTIITTTTEIDYQIGQEIRLLIPPSFGSIQLNGARGFVLTIPADDQVEVSINSTMADAFIASTSTVQSAEILAIGDINTGVTNTDGRNHQRTDVPGSFINISPK
jgi:hypothetical protein